jgi:hypothetical protein
MMEKKKSTTINVPPAVVDVTWLPEKPEEEKPKHKPGSSVKINPGCRIRIREV